MLMVATIEKKEINPEESARLFDEIDWYYDNAPYCIKCRIINQPVFLVGRGLDFYLCPECSRKTSIKLIRFYSD